MGLKYALTPCLASYCVQPLVLLTLFFLASQVTYCGPRDYVAQGGNIGDDSCEHANDGVCQDGGPGSVRYTNTDGESVALCGFATDNFDCSQRTLTTLGSLSFSAAGRPAAPLPPPSPPHPPPSPPPPFTACEDTCTTATDVNVCSDGGEGAVLVGGAFECDYGSQVRARHFTCDYDSH